MKVEVSFLGFPFYTHIGHSLSLICQPTSEDIKIRIIISTAESRVEELCKSRGGRPGLPILTSPIFYVDVKQN